jgi:hypothetical protein
MAALIAGSCTHLRSLGSLEVQSNGLGGIVQNTL